MARKVKAPFIAPVPALLIKAGVAHAKFAPPPGHYPGPIDHGKEYIWFWSVMLLFNRRSNHSTSLKRDENCRWFYRKNCGGAWNGFGEPNGPIEGFEKMLETNYIRFLNEAMLGEPTNEG